MRPVRTHISSTNLSFIGIPKKFHNFTIEKNFNTYGNSSLQKVKDFLVQYVNTIDEQFKNGQGLYFYGSNGVGKTFLGSLILKEAYMHRYSAKRVTFVDYINNYTRMWGAKTPEEKELLEDNFYQYYKGVEFLIIEEVGKEVDSKIATPILEDLLRYREDKGLVTIICTNLKLENIQSDYGNSVCSLIKGNMTPIKIVGVDKRDSAFKKKGA